MNEELISQVEELGLSNKEARVYVANLMLGPAGVQQIADASGIKRVTTYVILESLVNLGLASQTTKAKKTLFNAEAPENLRRLLEKREQSIKDQKQQLDELLPQLNSLKTLPMEMPSVRFYDGAEGIRTINKLFLDELANSHFKHTYGISNLDDVFEFFPEFKKAGANPDRVTTGIKSYFLYTSKNGPILSRDDESNIRVSKFVDNAKFPIQGDTSIVGDKVMILSLRGGHPTGAVIHNPEFAKTMKSVFELAWKQLGGGAD
jgi:sugar-specific transcriptional regulator TrmB